jgi:hypothetical protein
MSRAKFQGPGQTARRKQTRWIAVVAPVLWRNRRGWTADRSPHPCSPIMAGHVRKTSRAVIGKRQATFGRFVRRHRPLLAGLQRMSKARGDWVVRARRLPPAPDWQQALPGEKGSLGRREGACWLLGLLGRLKSVGNYWLLDHLTSCSWCDRPVSPRIL